MKPGMHEKKTLIIEDDGLNTKLLKIIFKKVSRVETASDGREGLDKLRKEYFDLIISDVEMPYMTGIELLKEVRKADPEIANRFLFFTGTANPDHINFMKDNNLNYLNKPSHPSRLMDIAEEILSNP